MLLTRLFIPSGGIVFINLCKTVLEIILTMFIGQGRITSIGQPIRYLIRRHGFHARDRPVNLIDLGTIFVIGVADDIAGMTPCLGAELTILDIGMGEL
jgi:hypothetical protein